MQKKVWAPIGKGAVAPSTLSRQRFYSFGALYQNGFDCVFYEKANGESFVDFVTRLKDRHGKVLVFTDNAGYHKSKHVVGEAARFNGDVVLRYFPPYTPELNPAEGQWRNMRIHAANRLYGSAEEMKHAISAMLCKGEIAVAKMSGYLV